MEYSRTRKATLRQALQPRYRGILDYVISDLAEELSVLRSDAWLALQLHMERNPSGNLAFDVDVSCKLQKS